jgi:hypothetical protein
MKSHLILLVILCAGAAQAADCTVHDQDLQGTYAGGCIDGLAQGSGVAQGRDEYRGDFAAGLMHGPGVYTWSREGKSAGASFSGRFERGQPAEGVFVRANGVIEQGVFEDQRLHGFGVRRVPSALRPELAPLPAAAWRQEGDLIVIRGVFGYGQFVAVCASDDDCLALAADQLRRDAKAHALACNAVRFGMHQVEVQARELPSLEPRALYELLPDLARTTVTYERFLSVARADQEQFAARSLEVRAIADIESRFDVPAIDQGRLRASYQRELASSLRPGPPRPAIAPGMLTMWSRLCAADPATPQARQRR